VGSDESGKLHRHGAQVGEGPGHLCRRGVQPHPAALSGVPGQLRGRAGVYSRGFGNHRKIINSDLEDFSTTMINKLATNG